MYDEKHIVNQMFFDVTSNIKDEYEEEYIDIQPCIDTLDTLSKISNLAFFILDYSKKEFLYCSPFHLLANYLSAEKMKEMKFSFLKEFTSPEDYEFLSWIYKEGFKFYYNLPKEDRLKYTLSYYFNSLINKDKILLNHKITPVKLNKKNEIWLCLCVATIANKGVNKEIEIKNIETSQRFIYNKGSRKWVEHLPVMLTEKEISILRLSMQGYTNLEIGNIMHFDINTIKFHKKRIFSKLNVSKIQDAISYAINNKLLLI